MIRTLTGLLLIAHAVTGIAQDIDLTPVTGLKADLGQVVELGTVAPVEGITSTGQPDAKALEVFADAGYATVIDLRGPAEDRGLDEAAVVEELGMHYVALPISAPDGVSFDNARRLDELIGRSSGPVLVHCGSGNRVGALLALRASINGDDDETALRHGRDAGLTSLESTVRERLAEGP